MYTYVNTLECVGKLTIKAVFNGKDLATNRLRKVDLSHIPPFALDCKS